MKLFTVGPTQMYGSTLEVRAKSIPYFRTEEFSKLNHENVRMLKECLDAEETTELILLTASGTGAMEAAVMNCLNENDKVLIIVGGTFGERFVDICRIHKIPFDVVKLEEGKALTKKRLYQYNGQGYQALLVNLHETQTGQLYDIELLNQFCKENEMYLIVDAISTFLCDPYSMRKNGIDVSIVSSQKGLCLAPGLSMVALSERMQKKMEKNTVRSLYFDFSDYLKNIKRGQTPFTPAVGIHYELHDRLEKILERGVEVQVKEVEQRARFFRERIKKLSVEIPTFPLSNAMTPVLFENEIAEGLVAFLKNEKGQMVNPTGGKLGKRGIRVSHIGDLKIEDYEELVGNIEEFLKQQN
ncbi:MAG: alanine--glyoxylate aminotransferase family protein [Lachnospiraceae bacterium]|nr:alanine--glyoxylate aminotransferase family protein [Lachnospiraceae bacterium]